MLIDAKNDRAAQWYEGYGALRLLDAPLSLVLPFSVVLEALKQGTEAQSSSVPLAAFLGLRADVQHSYRNLGATPAEPHLVVSYEDVE